MPTFSEQVSGQLGGVRGMVESGIPVVVFVVVNLAWSLRPALIGAVGVSLAIAAYRLSRRQSVRHAVNGLFGIGIGALLAWRSGDPADFYLPGILLNLAYGVALVGSVLARRPLVGWLWSVVVDGGRTRWYREEGLRRTFGWLTIVWAAVFLAKFVVNVWVYSNSALTADERASILGVMRVALGAPPYALLLALTIWAVRRYQRTLGTTALPA
jgi:hypothetical protein